jgi:acyl transferase domain-containing protein
MVGIATGVDTVQEVLAEIPGYVIAANKNCPTQTVIAGDSDATEAAIEAFKSRGITVYPLPVSHAFHSRIVAPASTPLKKVLGRLDIKAPQRPITTNVTILPTGAGRRPGDRHPRATGRLPSVDGADRAHVRGQRASSSSVGRSALTSLTVSILKRRRTARSTRTIRSAASSFLDALADSA